MENFIESVNMTEGTIGAAYELTGKYRQFAAAKNEEQKKDINQVYFD